MELSFTAASTSIRSASYLVTRACPAASAGAFHFGSLATGMGGGVSTSAMVRGLNCGLCSAPSISSGFSTCSATGASHALGSTVGFSRTTRPVGVV